VSGAPPDPGSAAQPPPPLPPPVRPGLTSQPGVGQASRCAASRTLFGSHRPSRFVWHHIQPQATGGKTEPANLVSLCDNCHYSVHAVLWALAHGESGPGGLSRRVRALAQQGYAAAVAAGTVAKIPHEA